MDNRREPPKADNIVLAIMSFLLAAYITHGLYSVFDGNEPERPSGVVYPVMLADEQQ